MVSSTRRRSPIPFEKIFDFVDSIFGGDMHAKRVLSLANATLGAMHAESLAIHLIGQGLAQAKDLEPVYARGSAYYRMKRKLGRRASIEPRIGHLKARFRLGRNFLKGIYGDMANVILAASAMNLVNWMGRFISAIFRMLLWSSRKPEIPRRSLTWTAPKFVEAF